MKAFEKYQNQGFKKYKARFRMENITHSGWQRKIIEDRNV